MTHGFTLTLWKVRHLFDVSQNFPIKLRILESLEKSVGCEQQLTFSSSVFFGLFNKRQIVDFNIFLAVSWLKTVCMYVGCDVMSGQQMEQQNIKANQCSTLYIFPPIRVMTSQLFSSLPQRENICNVDVIEALCVCRRGYELPLKVPYNTNFISSLVPAEQPHVIHL